MKARSSYEGLQDNVRKMRLPAIETWRNQYADRDYTINLVEPEFTCLCPKTGQPDFATLRIEYSPRTWCAELKSFKNYIVAYRNIGIFHEHAVNRILEDIVKAVGPKWAKVEGEFNMRGGIKTTVCAEFRAKGKR